MICPNCNSVVSDTVNFCEFCGAPLPAGAAQQGTVPSDNGDSNGTAEMASNQVNTTQSFGEQPSAASQTASYQQPYEDQSAGEAPYQQPYTAPQSDSYQQPYTGQPFDTQPTGQTGTVPPPPGVYAAPSSTGAQVSIVPFVLSIIAVVTAFLGLFPVSIVLAIVALVMNSRQKKRGEFSSKQTPTTIMSVISLVVSALVLVATIALGGLVAAYMGSEVANVGAGKSGNVSVSVTNSKSTSSTASAKSAASSAEGSDASGSSAASPSGLSATEISDKLVGSWKLTGLVSDGETVDESGVEAMQNMGFTVSLQINGDGSATLVLFGVNMTGNWESPDGTTVYLMLEGDRIQATAIDNTITLTEGTDELTFTKQ